MKISNQRPLWYIIKIGDSYSAGKLEIGHFLQTKYETETFDNEADYLARVNELNITIENE